MRTLKFSAALGTALAQELRTDACPSGAVRARAIWRYETIGYCTKGVYQFHLCVIDVRHTRWIDEH